MRAHSFRRSGTGPRERILTQRSIVYRRVAGSRAKMAYTPGRLLRLSQYVTAIFDIQEAAGFPPHGSQDRLGPLERGQRHETIIMVSNHNIVAADRPAERVCRVAASAGADGSAAGDVRGL